MTETLAPDVIAILEKPQPLYEELAQVRAAVCSQPEARRRVASLIASLPGDPAAGEADKALALKKGLALWAAGRESAAAEWLAHSGTKVGRLVRARCLVSCGRPAEAVKLLAEHAEDPAAAEVLAEAHANLGDAEAARAMTEVVARGGNEAQAEYLRGRVADLNGERAEAVQHYRRALAADPQHALALFRLAYDACLYGDEEEAAELYRRSVETPWPPVNAWLNLGNLYEDRGEFSKARECYEAVLKADPANPRALMFHRDALASLNMFYDEDLERRTDKRSQVLRLPVTDFELSVRSRNCLAKMGVRTLGDLIQRTEQELLSYKNFGETSLQEIKDILAQKGLRLGMAKEEVPEDEEARSILEAIGAGDAERRKLLAKPLTDLELSVRSRHCMNLLELKTVGDLVRHTEADLMAIKNFGQTSLNEVKQKLAEIGLSLAESAQPAEADSGAKAADAD